MPIASEFPDSARELLIVRGRDLLNTLGLPALRGVVGQVLCGVNIRSATESLTRRRLSLLNAGLVTTYVNLARTGIAATDIPSEAYSEYSSGSASLEDKIILRWMLGLTQKQVQNVLRSDPDAWADYVDQVKDGLAGSAATALSHYGDMPLRLTEPVGNEIDWTWTLSMLMSIGSQTLAIRGSEKSMYGKFFEKMIMGSVLSVLGFQMAEEDTPIPGTFWLSSRGRKRESDATAVWESGSGVRFDIGFIGVGNPEITLDKVSRFEREIEIAGVLHEMRTVIIVDRVGRNSRIIEMANAIDGTVVQMSSSDWAKTLGTEMETLLSGYSSPLSGLSHSEYVGAIEAGVEATPLEQIFAIAVSDDDDSLLTVEEDEAELDGA